MARAESKMIMGYWVESINTKPARAGARCQIIDLTDRRCPLTDFTPLLSQPRKASTHPIPKTDDLAAAFLMRGYRRCGHWLNGPCPYPHRHKYGDRRPSFGFNTRTSYGFRHVCGSMLFKDRPPCWVYPLPTVKGENRPCPTTQPKTR